MCSLGGVRRAWGMGLKCYFWVGTLGSEHKAGTQHAGEER